MQKAICALFVMEIPKYQVVQAISHTNVNENVLCTSTSYVCDRAKVVSMTTFAVA